MCAVSRARCESANDVQWGSEPRNDSNESLASDLAAFVREKQIGGRGFLRMTEADLDGYVRVFFSLSSSSYSLARNCRWSLVSYRHSNDTPFFSSCPSSRFLNTY